MERQIADEGDKAVASVMLTRSIYLWAVFMVLGGGAEALEGCFCARDNLALQKCGEVLRFDPSDAVALREYIPLNCQRRMAPEAILSFLKYTECEPPAELKSCSQGGAGGNGEAGDGTLKPPENRNAQNEKSPDGRVETRHSEQPPNLTGESFSIAGSNTVGEMLMPTLIAAYGRSRGLAVTGHGCNDDLRLQGPAVITIRCEAHGTHTGIPALANKAADIAMLSRPITPDEIEMMRRMGFDRMMSVPHESVIGLDGLRVIVSSRNGVGALSLDQIARIFAGEITDWSQVGGSGGRIRLYARDIKSGTRETFERLVMEARGERISETARSFESSSALAEAVERDPGGIGFIGFAYSGDTKALAISSSCGIQHRPTMLSIKAEDYPLSRRLYLYKARPKSVHAEDLVTYALSDAAQPVIAGAGYVNQAIEFWNETETRNRVRAYAAAPTREPGLEIQRRGIDDLIRDTNDARRLSISFRFRFGREDLDSKANDDILRLASYLKSQRGRGARVLLLGFADAVGNFNANLALAEKRAWSVRDALMKTGAALDRSTILAKGYGELMPVACNASDLGREKNRRVEVYLLDG